MGQSDGPHAFPSQRSSPTPPHRNSPPLRARRAHARQRPPPTPAASATRACSLGGVTGGSGRCNLLRRPREPADPGLVARSDVVCGIQTEGRRPAAASSSGSDSGVRNAPGCHPPRPPLVWAGECPPGPPPSSATVFASSLLFLCPRAPGDRCDREGSSGWALHPGSPWPPAGQPAAGLDGHPHSGRSHFQGSIGSVGVQGFGDSNLESRAVAFAWWVR